MPFVKGSTHTAEARQKMSAARRGKPHSEQHRQNIGKARRGQKLSLKHQMVCACGATFNTAAHNARFCSRRCARAARGHGLRHAPEFLCFEQRCAICETGEELVGDHDHTTGEPRGILCRRCNLAIGNMEDDPARLRAAADYLEAAR